MGQILFDTRDYTRILEKGGFSQQQADAMAEAQKQALEQMRENRDLATGRDILRLEKQMAEMEARLVKAIHNALFGFAAAIAACIAIAIAVLK